MLQHVGMCLFCKIIHRGLYSYINQIQYKSVYILNIETKCSNFLFIFKFFVTVPKYEVVRVLCSFNVANENDSRKMHIKAFAQEIELFLKLSNGYLASEDTPLWMVNSNQHALEGLQYTLIPNVSFFVEVYLFLTHTMCLFICNVYKR